MDLRPIIWHPLSKLRKSNWRCFTTKEMWRNLSTLERWVLVMLLVCELFNFLGKKKRPPLSPSQIDSLAREWQLWVWVSLIQGTFGSLLISAVHYSMAWNPCFGAKWGPPWGLLPLGPNEPTMLLPSFRVGGSSRFLATPLCGVDNEAPSRLHCFK